MCLGWTHECTLNVWSVDTEITCNYGLMLSVMQCKGFVHFKACCCMFFFSFTLYTRGLKEQWCQTVWTVFVSSLFLYFIHHRPPLCLWGRGWWDRAFQGPYCPVCQVPLRENLTASELRLLQNCWLNPNGASEHQRPPTFSGDWVCFCKINFSRIVKQK